jgi:superfamily I DNA/RNA helicase
MIGVSNVRLWASHRFFDDLATLPNEIQRKVGKVARLVLDQGVRHGSLQTKPIERNIDRRFHFMRVDRDYRMVVVLEGRDVLFDMVGPHDATERRGERATMRTYVERLGIDPETFVRQPRHAAIAEEPTLFGEQPVSLPQLVAEAENLSDLITGDIFGALDGYRDGLIEDWMIFLSPLQRRAVDRNLYGPARVTGGPGTGKTVVGLHRAKRLGEELDGGRRVLMTSFVRNIPETLDGLFERLAPDAHDRMYFRHIHELATDVLRTRDRHVRVNADAAHSRFNAHLTADPARRQALQWQGFTPDYLWDEVTRVIEGRGIEDVDTYLAVERHGRKRPMQEEARRLTWSLYEEYRAACDNPQSVVVDFERVLNLAYDALREEPTGKRYQAVIVDEAQDVTEVGLRFLLELLEDGPEGRLILIGDQAQRIYPGGFKLRDLGVDTRGRSITLKESYRSTDEIMQAVGALGRFLSPDDFGEDGLASFASATVRRGEKPTIRRFDSSKAETEWVLETLRTSADLDSIGLLMPTNSAADRWLRVLRDAGILTVPLLKWSGRPTPGVKVGTYHRSKGLEFKHVILAGLDSGYPWAAEGDADAFLMQGSVLYVAMSRARDQLDMTHHGPQSYFLEQITEHCTVHEAEPQRSA